MSRTPLTLLALLCLTGVALAQVEDRPLPAEPTRDQAAARLADQTRRNAQTAFGAGLMHQRRDRLLEALKELEEAVRLDPEAAEPRKALVPLYLMFARGEDALEAARAVVSRDPDDYEMWLVLATAKRDAGKPAEAADAFRKAADSPRLAKSPERRLLLLSDLAATHERMGKLDDASAVLRQILARLHEGHADLVNSRAYTEERWQGLVAQTHESLGKFAVERKAFAEAAAAFEAAQLAYRRVGPNGDAAAAVRLDGNLARIYEGQGEPAKALAHLDAYLASAPTEVEPYERRVGLLRKLGREEAILPSLRRAAAADPHHLRLQLLLARELGATPGGEEAFTLYEKLSTSYTNADIYRGWFRLNGRLNRADATLDALDAVWRQAEDKAALVEVRQQALERGRAMGAALKAEPDLVPPLVARALATAGRERAGETLRALGTLSARANRLAEADKLFERAFRNAREFTRPEIADAWIRVLWASHKPAAVADVCRQMLAGRDQLNQLLFRYHLALALADAGSADDALREIDAAVRLATDAGRLTVRLRKAHILRRLGRFNEAVRECEILLAENPAPAAARDIRQALSHVYSRTGDYDRAEAELRKILEAFPNDPGANNDLGYQMADRNKNLDEAEAMVRKALDADGAARKQSDDAEPENAAYLDSLGWVLFRKGQFDEAVKLLERSTTYREGADDPTVWDHLGDAYTRQGRADKAREAYRKAEPLYRRDRREYPAERLEELRRKISHTSP